MWKRVFSVLKVLAYLGALAVIFAFCAYLAFGAFVRRGGVPAPDLLGLSLDEARTLLVDKDLQLRHREQEDRYDDTVLAERILQQDPAPANAMKKGGVISVVLSKGQQLVEVPDLSGKAIQAAQTELAAAGLVPGRISRIYWPDADPNTVVLQEPASGAEINRGSELELFVAIEDPAATYVMPDLVYRRAEDVRRVFEAWGFRFGSVKYEPYEGVEDGIVLRHTPRAGHPLRRHDSITLVVATSAGP